MKYSILKILFFVSFTMFSMTAYSAEKISPKFIEGAKTVDVKKAKELFDKGALFVDVRSLKAWNEGRIPDSVLLDLKKGFDKNSLGEVAKKDEPIVIYCNGHKCLRSSKASQKAVAWGYKNVYYFRDGLPSWRSAGYPIE